ncbi:hypothetical protein BJF79_45710 [Actinomadura sp. CNU-125]|nr:hypothetical protein BJF79_45710 [Actinomadura sp. CNU-125]
MYSGSSTVMVSLEYRTITSGFVLPKYVAPSSATSVEDASGSSKPPSLNLPSTPMPQAPAAPVNSTIRTRLSQRRRWMSRPSPASIVLLVSR